MTFPGGLLTGCDAGTLNYAKIKGSHTAMKSGMIAAESVFEALRSGDKGGRELDAFSSAFESSWVYDELHAQRNFGPLMHRCGALLGGGLSWIDINVFNGKLPYTLHDKSPDYAQLTPASKSPKPDYPKPDGKLSFDKPGSVFLSNTNHEEDQPCHLHLTDADLPIRDNLPVFDEPAQRYCPAGVYEIRVDEASV